MKIDTSSPPKINLTMIRGDTETISISLKDKDDKPVSFNDEDIIYFTVKERASIEDKIIQKVITNFTDNKAFIKLYPEDTRGLKPSKFVYDIQLTKASGLIKTIVPKSDFLVLEDVTYE